MKLQMHDGTVITLSGDSTVVIEELRSARGQAPPTTQLLLEKGKISTQQTTRILGQTNQIIRTENGFVNTSLGEVEVWKPEPQTQEYALLAALSPEFPLVTKKTDKSENTYVTLNRGTLEAGAEGRGLMFINSRLPLETCPGQDGIILTLAEAKTQVAVSRLEEDNGYRVFSKDRGLFHLLVGTEGTANKIEVATRNSDAEVDLEGITVADQGPDSRLIVLMNPLLTVGVKSSDVKVKLICDPSESKGLNEVGVRGFGEHTVHTTSLGGRDTNRPLPSRGRMGVTPTPTLTPIPTERPEDEDEEEPIPTPEEEEEVGGPPPPVPLTYVFSPVPVLWIEAGDIVPTVDSRVAVNECTANQNRITVNFRYRDNSMGIYDKGNLIYRWRVFNAPALTPPWTPPWDGGAETQIRPSGGVTPLPPPPTPTYTFPDGESGRLSFSFCADFLGNDSIGVAIQLRNQGGYTSAWAHYNAGTFVP
jgi:hypothetical protein